MNNNMIKVLAVVVIAGGLWWFLKGGGDAQADCEGKVNDAGDRTHTWVAGACSDGTSAEADCKDTLVWTAGSCAEGYTK